MLLTNFTRTQANQSRALGGQLNPTQNWDYARMRTYYVGEATVPEITERMSFIEEGNLPPYVLVLPPTAGGMASYGYVSGTGTISTASGQNGYPISATLDGIGVISDAAAGLIVELVAALVGTGSVTASVVGALEAAAALDGVGTVSADVSALAGLVASLIGSGAITANALANGLMEAVIYVNQSQATVDQIVDGVLESLDDIEATVPPMLDTDTGSVIIPLD